MAPALPLFDWRVAALMMGGAALTGFVTAAAVVVRGDPAAFDLILVAEFLAGGTAFRTALPAAAIWLLASWLVRRGGVTPRVGAMLGAVLIALAGWLIFIAFAEQTFGPRIWNWPAPRAGLIAALSAMFIFPALAATLFRSRSLT